MSYHIFLTNKKGFNHLLCHDGAKFYLGGDLGESVVFDSKEEIDTFIKNLKSIKSDSQESEDYEMDVFGLVDSEIKIEKIIGILD
jgi:hypothetical protein